MRLSVLLEGANDNYVLITIQDDVDGMKSSKQTSTLEGSGAAPKWKAGEGETLIFHGLHLGKIDLLVSALVTRRAIIRTTSNGGGDGGVFCCCCCCRRRNVSTMT